MTQTQTMTITEIFQIATSSTDIWSFDGSAAGWMTLMQQKAADSGFGRLVDSILEDGWAEGSSIGIREGQICQGHHRLVAAILLGMDSVEITYWGTDGGRNVCAHSDPGPECEFDLFDDIPYQEEY